MTVDELFEAFIKDLEGNAWKTEMEQIKEKLVEIIEASEVKTKADVT